MHYIGGIALAAVIFLLIPYPFSAILLVGLVLGGVLHLSDRVGRLEDRTGVKHPDDDIPKGSDPYAEAERRRLRRLLDKDNGK